MSTYWKKQNINTIVNKLTISGSVTTHFEYRIFKSTLIYEFTYVQVFENLFSYNFHHLGFLVLRKKLEINQTCLL